MKSIVVIGDVGVSPLFHLGDEAMLDALMRELSARLPTRWTVVSANPAETASRYGVGALPRIGFDGLDRADSDELLHRTLRTAEGSAAFPVADRVHEVLDAVAACDLVIIAGGGNLNSRWPGHIYERAALAGAALRLAKPLLISGQTLGPEFFGRDAELVSATVTGAQFVGVRERASASLAHQLGVPVERIWCAPDDASYLVDEPAGPILSSLDLEPHSYVAATINPYGGPFSPQELVPRWAELLDQVGKVTELPIVLIPHLGRPGSAETDDVAYHDEVAAGVTTARVEVLPLLSGPVTGWITRNAALVLANRYHPVVFGVSADVPTVGVAVDEYTQIKIEGALAWSGSGQWCVSAAGLGFGFLLEAITERWERRDDWGPETRAAERKVWKDGYWDAMAAVIAGDMDRQPDPARLPREGRDDAIVEDPADRPNYPPGTSGGWRLRNRDSLHWEREVSRRRGESDWVAEQATQRLARLKTEVDDERGARLAAVDEVAELAQALDVQQAAVRAAQQLNGVSLTRIRSVEAEQERLATALAESTRRWTAVAADLADYAALQHEYAALGRTKLLRWTRTPRRFYSRLRLLSGRSNPPTGT